MEEDQTGTQRLLESIHQIFRTETRKRGGRVIQIVGDNVLALYNSVTSGLKCALEIQHGIAELNQGLPENRHMYFRIGLHTGDVYIKPQGTVYGDTINIAARLESLGEPGRIVVSGAVKDQIESDTDFSFEPIGPQTLKNISREVHAYRVDAA
jgi:adenylate cyclase